MHVIDAIKSYVDVEKKSHLNESACTLNDIYFGVEFWVNRIQKIGKELNFNVQKFAEKIKAFY